MRLEAKVEKLLPTQPISASKDYTAYSMRKEASTFQTKPQRGMHSVSKKGKTQYMKKQKYSTVGNGTSRVDQNKWSHPGLYKKPNYKTAVELAKPNSNLPTWRKGDADRVAIPSYRLLRKEPSRGSE